MSASPASIFRDERARGLFVRNASTMPDKTFGDRDTNRHIRLAHVGGLVILRSERDVSFGPAAGATSVSHARRHAVNGAVIPVMKYREVNVTFLASGTLDIIAMDRIPISPYTVVGLSARVHALDIGTGSFKFHVYGVAPSPDDGRDFVTSSLGDTGAMTGTPPLLFNLSTVITNPQTPFARVVLQAAGGSGNLFGIFSADLVLKTG